MAEKESRREAFDRYVRELADYTGVSEEQIRRIVDMIGTDRPSVIREARIIKSLSKSDPGKKG